MLGKAFSRRLLALWGAGSSRVSDAVLRDAAILIDVFGPAAYDEARTRARDARLSKIIDGNRPPGHWDNVRKELGRRTKRG